MKYLKQLFTVIIVALFMLTTFSGNAQKIDDNYIEENIAIIDINSFNLNKDQVIVEITLKDYSGKKMLPIVFGLNGYDFTDDGKGNDKIANDGVFTIKESVSKTKINKNYSSKVLTSSKFKHQNKMVITKGIGCKFERCDGCFCLACQWWGHSCWCVTECEIIFF